MNRAQTAAVVVTYNRRDMLEKCIDCLTAQTAACDILVVNNHSTDDTQAYLQMRAAQQENLLIRHMEENLGGAGGFNAGMRWAVEAGYSHVWIMDDDTLPRPDALEKLLEADQATGGEYGFLSSVALWTDGRGCRMNRQKLKKAYYEKVQLLGRGMILIDQATFVSCLFRTETIRKAGLPIREFFIWGDDIEYTRRLSVRMGLPSYLVGQSVVVHAMKGNTGSSIAVDGEERIARYHYAFRNENYLYRKEGIKGFAYYTAKCALNLMRIAVKAKDHRLKRCAIIIRQYVGGLFFNPDIEYIDGKTA